MAGAPQTSAPDRGGPRPSDPGALTIQEIVSPRWSQNCYVLEDPARRTAVAIDPGHGCAAQVAACLAASGCRLEYIVLTHEHHDHIADVEALRVRHGVKVVAAGAASRHLSDPKANLSAFYPGLACAVAPADLLVERLGGVLPWGAYRLALHPTPGHSEGSICVAVGTTLFAGDTLIPGTRTVVKLPRGDKAALARTLDFLFSSFPPDTLVFPGHGARFRLSSTARSTHATP